MNKKIDRKPFPFPKIQYLLLKLEGLKYATLLDLYIYGITSHYIMAFLKKDMYYSTLAPWGENKYQKLPKGLCNSSDKFQESMIEFFNSLEYIRTYIDDLLIISNKSY